MGEKQNVEVSKSELENMVGYKKQTIDKICNLLNTIPVADFIATKSKMEIYETILHPDYAFDEKSKGK